MAEKTPENPYGVSPEGLIFIEHYLAQDPQFRNAAQAYRDAGLKNKNPRKAAARMLNGVAVQREIQRRMHGEILSHQLTAQTIGPTDVLERAAMILNADVTDTVEKKGNKFVLKDIGRMAPDTIFAIKKLKFNAQGQLVDVEMYSKTEMIRMLGDHFKLWKPEDGGRDAELLEKSTTLEKRLETYGEVLTEKVTRTQRISRPA